MKQSTAEKWASQAQYDLETAKSMLASGRYLYVLFCCQQAIEKILKSLIVKRTGEFPPRVHQLNRLAEIAGIALDEKQAEFFREISSYYIQTRYPEEIGTAAQSIETKKTTGIYTRTEELFKWLSSMS